MHERSADTSLAQIHQEMSELFDKQINVQKESLSKNFQGSCKLPQAHKKVCDENESRLKINDMCLKIFLREGRR